VRLRIPSAYAKKHQQAFLALLPGMDFISILGDCAKKCQQAFLALLPGTVVVLVFEPSSLVYHLFLPFFSFLLFSKWSTNLFKTFLLPRVSS
jgi:hypothetical protein